MTDQVIQDMVEAAIAAVPAPDLQVRVRNGVAILSGVVARESERNRAAELAGQVEGVSAVLNEVVVDPSLDREPLARGMEPAYAVEPEDLEEIAIGESPEPDLNQPVGTTNPLRPEVDAGEPYFPATDPVIEPMGRAEGGYRVLGGYSEGSMDRPLSAEPGPQRLENEDEQIAENVRLALKEDATTTDLPIHVHVRNGVVYLHGQVHYLQDVEAAEEVAGRIAGVREVREQLQLE